MMMINSIKTTSHQVCCIVAKFLAYAARPIPYIRTLRYKATVDATAIPRIAICQFRLKLLNRAGKLPLLGPQHRIDGLLLFNSTRPGL